MLFSTATNSCDNRIPKITKNNMKLLSLYWAVSAWLFRNYHTNWQPSMVINLWHLIHVDAIPSCKCSCRRDYATHHCQPLGDNYLIMKLILNIWDGLRVIILEIVLFTFMPTFDIINIFVFSFKSFLLIGINILSLGLSYSIC